MDRAQTAAATPIAASACNSITFLKSAYHIHPRLLRILPLCVHTVVLYDLLYSKALLHRFEQDYIIARRDI